MTGHRTGYAGKQSAVMSVGVGSAFAIVAFLTFICFLPDLGNALLEWDDSGYILNNTHIHTLSLETFRGAFGDFYLNYWAPLTWLSLAFDYALWGTNPVGYHLVNNLLHALNAGMFFLVSRELLSAHARTGAGDPISSRVSLYCALLAALLFAIHPLRVESVAWATERKDVLSLFFGLPAVLFYLRHVRTTESRTWSFTFWYVLSLVFFLLSLLSKSLVITLPAVLLVLDWFPLKRLKTTGIPALLLEKLPYFLLSGVVSLITMRAQVNAITSFEQINLFTRVLNGFNSIMAYVRLSVWPFDISPFYVHPNTITSVSLDYAVAILFFVVVTLFCILTLKRLPILMAVWLIYLITLLPFLGFTQVGPQAMAGRFTYLAGLPLALLFAVGVTFLYARIADSRSATVTLGIGVALLLSLNGFLTVREISFWKDDVTLWTRVIDLSPHVSGRAYFQRSNAYRISRDYQRSIEDIDKAFVIAKKKNYNAMHELYVARAGIYSDMGAFAEVVADYTKALETAPATSRKMIFYERGTVYKKMGKFELADEDFKQSENIAGLQSDSIQK